VKLRFDKLSAMTVEEYGEIETALETALEPLRRNEAHLKVGEIRIRANLESVRAELFKLVLRKKEEESHAPFCVIRMDDALNHAS
jgi:hypothetical protein